MVCTLCAAGGIASIYQDGLRGNSVNGIADLYRGEITGMPSFQRQMAVLFYDAQIAAGSGQNLSSNQRKELAQSTLAVFQKKLPGDGILFTFTPYGQQALVSNSNFPLFDEGKLSPPPGYSVLVATDGTQYWGSYAILDAYDAYAGTQAAQPDLQQLQQAKTTVALMLTDAPAGTSRYYGLQQQATRMQAALIAITALLCAAAVFCMVCLVLFRRAKPARAWAASVLARIPLEAKLLLWLAVFLVLVRFNIYTALGGVLVCAWPILWLACVDFAHNKAGVFKNSLCWRLARWLHHGAAAIATSLAWQKRALALLVVGSTAIPLALLVAAVSLQFTNTLRHYISSTYLYLFAFLLGLAVGLLCVLRLARLILDMGKISHQIHQLSTGKEPPSLPLAHTSALYPTAADLHTLQAGITQMVDARTKSERMKVELITNVSHDLKTPLTSIISYTQLLQEEPLDDTARDYAAVIARKANQLKSMVQDVFELSKASSGELSLQPAPLDLVKLLNQTLADMDEAVQQSGFALRTQLPQSAWVCVDGDHMYRVFQNLLCNALQYSLQGSRIYLDAVCTEAEVITTIKNISKNEITFTPDRIVERFVRADQSRSGEGHGLGLSIAKSFTEACGGRFSIETQGDLFCVSVGLDIINQPQMQKEEPPEAPQAVDAQPATAGV